MIIINDNDFILISVPTVLHSEKKYSLILFYFVYILVWLLLMQWWINIDHKKFLDLIS